MRAQPSSVRLSLGLSLCLWSACSGQVEKTNAAGDGNGTGDSGGSGSSSSGSNGGSSSGGGGQNSSAPTSCKASTPPAWALRRLTSFEYDNTVRDLLSTNLRPGRNFEPENAVLGFDNSSHGALTNDKTVAQYEVASEELANAAVANPGTFLGCDTLKTGEDTCVKNFLPGFLRKAFRGTVPAADVQPYVDFFLGRKKTDGFSGALALTIQAVLLAPEFLYHVENAGAPALASRLSYLLWGSAPDQQLLDAAEQARRLLADPKADDMLLHFHAQWLQMGSPGGISKDAALFPNWKTISPASFEETKLFLAAVFRDGDAKLSTLMTANFSFMNKTLADAYGVAGPKTATFERVSLDTTKRRGILSQITVLASHANATEGSIVRRGKFILDQILCQPLPPPPANVPPLPPAKPGGAVTNRARLAAHTANTPCSGCHNILNPPGYAFEHYDAIGTWRETDHGQSVDSSTSLMGTDIEGHLSGATELAERVAQSKQAQDCAVGNWFHYAYERGETDADACALAELKASFSKSGGDVRELLVSLVRGPSFLQGAVQ
jgi:hypothetical protein